LWLPPAFTKTASIPNVDVQLKDLSPAESEIVIEECLRNARSALRDGDRERALEEVRRGFLVRKNDPRLLEMHREVVQQ